MPAGRLPRCEIIPPSSKVLDVVIHNDMTLVLRLKGVTGKEKVKYDGRGKREKKKRKKIACVRIKDDEMFLYNLIIKNN